MAKNLASCGICGRFVVWFVTKNGSGRNVATPAKWPHWQRGSVTHCQKGRAAHWQRVAWRIVRGSRAAWAEGSRGAYVLAEWRGGSLPPPRCSRGVRERFTVAVNNAYKSIKSVNITKNRVILWTAAKFSLSLWDLKECRDVGIFCTMSLTIDNRIFVQRLSYHRPYIEGPPFGKARASKPHHSAASKLHESRSCHDKAAQAAWAST